MIDIPRCDKHGVSRTWRKDRHKKAGGYWRCPACHSSKNLDWYYGTDKGRAALRRQGVRATFKARAARIQAYKERRDSHVS